MRRRQPEEGGAPEQRDGGGRIGTTPEAEARALESRHDALERDVRVPARSNRIAKPRSRFYSLMDMAKPTTLEQLIEVASGMMAQAESAAFSDERFAELSMRQTLYLSTILRNDGITLGELAEALGVSRPSVTAVAGTLASKGFVQKRQDPSDRRVYHLVPTDKARAFDRLHAEIHRRMATRFTEHLNEGEIRTLTRLFTKALGNPED